MSLNRRDLMSSSAAAFALLAVQAGPRAFAEALQSQPQQDTTEVADYWEKFYENVQEKSSDKVVPEPMRKTVYLHCPDSGGDVKYAQNLPASMLPAIAGDVQVKMAISQYRPAKGDPEIDVTQFRIDATQTFDYMNIIAPLSWAAIASFTPDKSISKLPTIDQLGFHASADQASLKQIILPNGVGKLAVNITKPANPQMIEIVKAASVGVTELLQMMVLPAISVPAVKVFTTLFGKWMSHATIVMNGNLQPVRATSVAAPDMVMPKDPMPLINGYYVMFPRQHEQALVDEMKSPGLTVQNGFLVHKNAPETDDLDMRAKTAVQGVSYATMRMYIDKAPAAACSAKPVPANA